MPLTEREEMNKPDLRYMLNTPLNELLRVALLREPDLRTSGDAVSAKLRAWALENDMSIDKVTFGLILWLATGTDEAQNMQQSTSGASVPASGIAGENGSHNPKIPTDGGC